MRAWLTEQADQARDAARRARGGDPVFHASAIARYVAMMQALQQLDAR